MFSWIKKIFAKKEVIKEETLKDKLDALTKIHREHYSRQRSLNYIRHYDTHRADTPVASQTSDGFLPGLAAGIIVDELMHSHSDNSAPSTDTWTGGGGSFAGGGASDSWDSASSSSDDSSSSSDSGSSSSDSGSGGSGD